MCVLTSYFAKCLVAIKTNMTNLAQLRYDIPLSKYYLNDRGGRLISSCDTLSLVGAAFEMKGGIF